MNNRIIKSAWIEGKLSLTPGNVVQISIVAYEHADGLPARFCAGLIPAAEVSKQLQALGFESVVRVIDPTPIASYCNGWSDKMEPRFRNVIDAFFKSRGVALFFDEAEPPQNEAIELLQDIGKELESPDDRRVVDAIQRSKMSGRRHGGDSGVRNSMLYMAAHPFSWLDMYHPLIWKRTYPGEGHQYVNLLSMAEERFAVIRKFLCRQRPDLCTGLNQVDRFMTLCSTPCYIPVDGEPLLSDLDLRGYDWCRARYRELKDVSTKHARALKDFEALVAFLSAQDVT